MPHTNEFTTAESIVVAHSLYMLIVGFTIGAMQLMSDAEGRGAAPLAITPAMVVGLNVAITAVTVAYVMQQYAQFQRLCASIKAKFQSAHPLVGTYGEIDAQI